MKIFNERYFLKFRQLKMVKLLFNGRFNEIRTLTKGIWGLLTKNRSIKNCIYVRYSKTKQKNCWIRRPNE